LPEPTLTLTLPSIQDNTALDCRVYHPLSLSPSPKAPTWDRHVAVVAHPYSPLGGCQDDRIVTTASGTLLRLGFLVATFNFRGAGGSAGRTTWTGKAERADYMSVAGFLVYYSHYLNPFSTAPSLPGLLGARPVFLFAGYSYGGNIVMQLPALSTILSSFEAPATGSPAAEIRMRAQHTAEMQNTVLASARAVATKPHGNGERSPRKSLGVRIGGDEENRSSHDSRRSFSFDPDEIKKGVADIMHKTARRSGHRKSHHHGAQDPESVSGGRPDTTEGEREQHLPAVSDLIRHRPAYLLISPPQGVFRNILNLSFTNPFSRKLRRSTSQPLPSPPAELPPGSSADRESRDSPETSEAEHKLIQNATFVIYGDQDVFIPLKRTREWAASLQAAPDSLFRAHEVSRAGHFWVE
ncbi:hypothetical protein GQ53DRAFT_584849, partial [Thozetella sp. PMI_491]